jgi:hypothetical protein
MSGSSISIVFEDGTSSEMTFSRRIAKFAISDGDVDGVETAGPGHRDPLAGRGIEQTHAPAPVTGAAAGTPTATGGPSENLEEDDLLAQPWSVRVQIGLERGNVRRWSDLARKTDQEMLWLCDGNKRALQEIRQRLRERGLSLSGGDTVIIHPNEALAEA